MLNQSKLPFNPKTDLRRTLRVDEILLAVAIGLLLVTIVGYAKAETHFEDNFEAYGDDVKIDSAGEQYTSSCGNSRWWTWNDFTYTGTRALSGTTWREGCNDMTIEFDTSKTNASTKFYINFRDTTGVGQNFIFYNLAKDEGCLVNVEDTEITKNTWHEAYLTTWFTEAVFYCKLEVPGEEFTEQSNNNEMEEATWLLLQIDTNCGQNEYVTLDDFQPAIEMPIVNIQHEGVITAYPNLAIIGTTGITAIRSEGYFSFKNSYYITIREGETGGLDYLAGQDLVLATSTYVLYEHTGTTSIQIATSTTVQNATATAETIYVCSPGIACYDYTVIEETTFFDVAVMDVGKMYYVVPILEFYNMEFIGESELAIHDDTPPTWTRHWFLKGDFNILTDEWEFNSPTEQYIHTGGEPADYTGGVSTTTGEIIVDWGTFGEFVSKYLSFLQFQQGTTIFKILDVMFNPRSFILRTLETFNLKTKIPFSYIYEIRTLIETELENLGTYNASTTAGTMYFDIGTDVWEINIVDIAQAKSDYSSEFGNLRDIIHYSLWLGFVFYLVRKLQVVSRGI